MLCEIPRDVQQILVWFGSGFKGLYPSNEAYSAAGESWFFCRSQSLPVTTARVLPARGVHGVRPTDSSGRTSPRHTQPFGTPMGRQSAAPTVKALQQGQDYLTKPGTLVSTPYLKTFPNKHF